MRRILVSLAALTLMATAGCGDPCKKLEKKICAHVKDDRACERSKKDMEDFTPEICSNALTIFEKMYDK